MNCNYTLSRLYAFRLYALGFYAFRLYAFWIVRIITYVSHQFHINFGYLMNYDTGTSQLIARSGFLLVSPGYLYSFLPKLNSSILIKKRGECQGKLPRTLYRSTFYSL